MKKIKRVTWIAIVHCMFVLALVVAHEELIEAYNFDNANNMTLRQWFVNDMKIERPWK